MAKHQSDQRKKELAIIHIGKQQLGLDDDVYQSLLWTAGRVKSSADLDSYGRSRMIKLLQQRGFVMTTSAGKPGNKYPGHPGGVGADREKLIGKVEALLADMTLPWSYADSIAQQMYKVDRVRFCTGQQLIGLVTALTKRQRKIEEGGA